MKKVSSIFHIVVMVLISLVVISAMVQLLQGATVPMFAGFGGATVLTGSMEPNIPAGSVVVILASENYQTGDAVMYQSGKTNITHRIINIQDGMITTQGDANNVADTPFPEEQILGKVILTIPLLGYLLLKLRTPAGLALLVMILLMIYIIPMIFKGKERAYETD